MWEKIRALRQRRSRSAIIRELSFYLPSLTTQELRSQKILLSRLENYVLETGNFKLFSDYVFQLQSSRKKYEQSLTGQPTTPLPAYEELLEALVKKGHTKEDIGNLLNNPTFKSLQELLYSSPLRTTAPSLPTRVYSIDKGLRRGLYGAIAATIKPTIDAMAQGNLTEQLDKIALSGAGGFIVLFVLNIAKFYKDGYYEKAEQPRE